MSISLHFHAVLQSSDYLCPSFSLDDESLEGKDGLLLTFVRLVPGYWPGIWSVQVCVERRCQCHFEYAWPELFTNNSSKLNSMPVNLMRSFLRNT